MIFILYEFSNNYACFKGYSTFGPQWYSIGWLQISYNIINEYFINQENNDVFFQFICFQMIAEKVRCIAVNSHVPIFNDVTLSTIFLTIINEQMFNQEKLYLWCRFLCIWFCFKMIDDKVSCITFANQVPMVNDVALSMYYFSIQV